MLRDRLTAAAIVVVVVEQSSQFHCTPSSPLRLSRIQHRRCHICIPLAAGGDVSSRGTRKRCYSPRRGSQCASEGQTRTLLKLMNSCPRAEQNNPLCPVVVLFKFAVFSFLASGRRDTAREKERVNDSFSSICTTCISRTLSLSVFLWLWCLCMFVRVLVMLLIC